MNAVAAGLLLIRLVAGLLVAAHGSQKLLGWFGGPGLRGTATMFERGGLGPGRVTAPVGGAAELLGGLSIALGLVTPLGAIALLVMMAGAIVAVHARNGLWNTNGGAEFPLVLAAIGLMLTLTGPGRWSIDRALGWDLAGWWWAAAAVIATIAAIVVDLALIRTHRMNEDRPVRPERPARERDRDVA